jgi:ABC-type amino acid transport substrate-binding protein
MGNVFVGDDLTGVLRMLNARRVDLLITARINGLLMAKELGLDAIKSLSPPLNRFWVYHYLHERHKDLVPTINAVFKAMQESGELEALREQAAQQLLQKADKQD